jgi:xylulokinase
MEGVAFALRDNLEALKSTGTQLNQLLAIGGGTQSQFWVETLATILQVPIDLPAQGEFGAALGAARLAMASQPGADLTQIMTRPTVATTIEPRAELVDDYSASYAKFRALYPHIKAALT